MAEKQTIQHEIALRDIAATDGELILLVRELETAEGEMSFEELDNATELLRAKAEHYKLSIDEMNTVYEMIRDQSAVSQE